MSGPKNNSRENLSRRRLGEGGRHKRRKKNGAQMGEGEDVKGERPALSKLEVRQMGEKVLRKSAG